RIADGIPRGQRLLHLAEHRTKTVVGSVRRWPLIADEETHGLVGQRVEVKLFVDGSKRGVAAGKVDVVIVSLRGRPEQNDNWGGGDRFGQPPGGSLHFAPAVTGATSEEEIRDRSSLKCMTSCWSFTG